MNDVAAAWPAKTREVASALFDSTRWNGFDFHDGDVVVATYAKTGTTWTQQIVWQLLAGAPEGVFSTQHCPWVDMRPPDRAEMLATVTAQTGRRCLKTHLPLDALVFSRQAKYLYVGRDARDMVWSAYNHHAGFTDRGLAWINAVPGDWPPLVKPPCDIRDYYLHFLDHDDLPGFGLNGVSFWDHVQGWWDARRLANVKLLHFNALRADLEGEIGKIAGFIEVEIDQARRRSIVEHCTFDYMQTIAAGAHDLMDAVFEKGALTFFNKGVNGRWKDVLSAAEIARCDAVAAERLTPDCAHWLKTGEGAG